MSESEQADTAAVDELFEPFVLGGVRLRNRVVFPAMLTNFATNEGFATPRNVAFYARRANGGTGLIIVEPTAVSPQGRASPNMLSLYDDRCVPNLSQLVDAIKGAGSSAFIQLTHAGRETNSALIGAVPVARSAIGAQDCPEVPQELDVEGIEGVICDFVASTRRAREAGFDGVQFCAGRGHLIQQFLSSASNRRSDDFGGEIWGRSRLLRDIVSRTRAELGPDYPILVRLPSQSESRGGLSTDELQELARALEGVGASGIEVGHAAEFPMSLTRLTGPDGKVARASPAHDIKRVVGIVVIDEGNVRDLDEAALIIRRGQADLVAVGRPLVADPDLVAKATAEPGEPCPCIYNNVCCSGEPTRVVSCPANPTVGREMLAASPPRVIGGKKIVVVGAGLVGLQVAYLAAKLGFHVTLYEESGLLGGLLALRARIPAQTNNYRIVDYLSRALVRLNVRLKLNSTPLPEKLLAETPYAVFITRRGQLLNPGISGLSNIRAVDPAETLTGEIQVADKVCVIGGGLLAAEVAYFLAQRRKTVTLLNQHHLCYGYDRNLRKRNLAAFREMEGRFIDDVKDIEINIYGELTVVAGARTHKVIADTIVLACGYETADDRYGDLEKTLERFYPVGDAYESVILTDLVYQATQTVFDLAAECAR